jgi:plastocyanin
VPRPAIRLLALIAAFGLLLTACGDDADTADAGSDSAETSAEAAPEGCETDVCMEGIAFTEDNITVAAGDTVTWTNLDSATHTVTAGDENAPNPDEFDSGNLGQDESFDLVVADAGEVAYYCQIHPQMQGTITVE